MTAAAVGPGELLTAAKEAAARAYIPYSRFAVGAALLTARGTVIRGCNVENASYGLTICAERTAITTMIAASAEDRSVVQVAVASPNAAPCFPCGACRQVLREFGCREVIVEEDGSVQAYSFEDLLPHSFGPEDLPGEVRH